MSIIVKNPKILKSTKNLQNHLNKQKRFEEFFLFGKKIKKKNALFYSFPILGGDSIQALQSRLFQNPGGVTLSLMGEKRKSLCLI